MTRSEVDRARRDSTPRCEECGSRAAYLGIVWDRGATRVLCPQCEAVAGDLSEDFRAAIRAATLHVEAQ